MKPVRHSVPRPVALGKALQTLAGRHGLSVCAPLHRIVAR
jgi:hypothetical protein